MLVFIILLVDGAFNVLVVLLIPEKEVQGGPRWAVSWSSVPARTQRKQSLMPGKGQAWQQGKGKPAKSEASFFPVLI